MQEYASSDTKQQPSDKDLATRGAEHHPTEATGGDINNQIATDNPNNNDNGNTDNKLYKGDKQTRNKFLAGPLKAPTFVRTTSRFDYQPDICKDYKDTGFCGFGDGCIYLHDRGNTLNGWQLEEEYERKKKLEQDKKQRDMDLFCQEINGSGNGNTQDGNGNGNTLEILESISGSGGTDDLPFACFLCRQPFKEPVVTGCSHYFCQKCIMEHVKANNRTSSGSGGGSSASTSASCPICQKDTHGVFNYPTKLHQKKKRLGCFTWQEFAAKSSGRSAE